MDNEFDPELFFQFKGIIFTGGNSLISCNGDSKERDKAEKKIYTLLSAYIRAPGCTYTFAIGMNGVFNYYNIGDYKSLILLMITISLIFWNGQ